MAGVVMYDVPIVKSGGEGGQEGGMIYTGLLRSARMPDAAR